MENKSSSVSTPIPIPQQSTKSNNKNTPKHSTNNSSGNNNVNNNNKTSSKNSFNKPSPKLSTSSPLSSSTIPITHTSSITIATSSGGGSNSKHDRDNNGGLFKQPLIPINSSLPSSSGTISNIKKSGSASSFTSLFSQGNNRMRMSYSPSNTTTTTTNNSSSSTNNSGTGSLASSLNSSSSSFSTSPATSSTGFLKPSISNTSINSSSSGGGGGSPFSPIPSPRGLYKPSANDNSEFNNNNNNSSNTTNPGLLLLNYSGGSGSSSSSSFNSNYSMSTSPNLFLKPSPSTTSNNIQPGHNSFLKPLPTSSAVYNSIPKTKTIGFSVSPQPSFNTNTTTTTSNYNLKKENRKDRDQDEIMGDMEDDVIDNDNGDIDFGTADDSSDDDEIHDAEEEDYEIKEEDVNDGDDEEEEDEDMEQEEEEYDNKNNNNNNNNNTIVKSKRNNNTSTKNTTKTTGTTIKNNNIIASKKYINIESLNNQFIEKMVSDGWNEKITPRPHQKEAVNLILQDIFNSFKKNQEQLDKEIFKIPKIKSEFIEEESNLNQLLLNKTINNKLTTTTTTTTSNVVKQSEHSTRNYLIQHAAGSGKSLTIASLVFNLYRLLEGGKKKYDLILILNDRRHLDTQLGNIVSKFLKDNDFTSIHHPNTVLLLDKILTRAKTRVVITTMQKFTNLIEKKAKFDRISSKYNSIALISDEAHRSHGKSMSRNIHSILTGETRQNSNITYFCFTCTPTARCLEMFGETKGNLKVPFHCYSLERALQDKLVLSVVDNYTTVSILTKVSNNNNNNEDSKTTTTTPTMLDEKKTSYHLLKNVANDKKILQEKAQYIIKHFVKICETVNNDEFKCRAMLVTTNRNQILLYKTILEQLIKGLPKEQRFDIVATFSPFVYRKKVKMDSDQKINGKYAKYFKKRDGISDIIRKDRKNHNVQLIIVADKLQTGFDEPSLAVMYVDKTLKGANAVQTLGRLSRLSKGKKSSYVVDFCNSRKEISDSFSQYWRETHLKGATRKTVLEIKLNRLYNKFSDIDSFSKGRIAESVEYILRDDEVRKKERRNGSLTDDITNFVNLCNQLFWDNNTSPMNVRFLESVKFGVCQSRSKSQLTSIRGLLRNIENKSTLLGSSTSSIKDFNNNNNNRQGDKDNHGNHILNLKNNNSFKLNRQNLTSSENIISSFNKREEYRAMELLKPNSNNNNNNITNNSIIGSNINNPMDLDADNLEFAKEMWSSNPEFKLQSSLLAPLTPEELDQTIKLESNFNINNNNNTNKQNNISNNNNSSIDNDIDMSSIKNVNKMIILHPNSSNSMEEVIDVVVEFVSRNGTTFENFIHNQSLAKLFPFINPSHPNHFSYKSKLEKARHELHQKEVQEQLHIKLEHHKQLMKVGGDNDITMNDSTSSNSGAPYGQMVRHSSNQINIQIMDVPLPSPLPDIPPEAIAGKPHSPGHFDDCLLDDCILSFVHDLESNELGVRVFAVQTLYSLASKGIHKNNMHEIIGAINRILLNGQENLSLKMVALDLLCMVALFDELTINQLLENNLTQTAIKLIQSAEEPLKAKSCKFFTILSSDITMVSSIIENHGITSIIACLDSYDYYVTEHALKLLISLSHEDRTIKLIRSNIDTNIWSRLEHHKINNINELCQQLRTLISGTKRALSQFQPSINTKRIRPTTILTKSN